MRNLKKVILIYLLLLHLFCTIKKDILYPPIAIPIYRAQQHLQNYALLYCEAYVYLYGDVSGWKEKVDEIRYEGLWLLNNLQKFSKNDQQLIRDYLNGMD